MVAENPVNAIAIASNLVQRFAVRYEKLYVPINPSRIAGQLGITVSREPKNDLNRKWIALALPSRKWIRLVSQEDEEKTSVRRQIKMGTSMSLWYCLAGNLEQPITLKDVMKHENTTTHVSARAFAFELLMPYQSILQLVGIHKVNDALLLARTFDVELDTLALRLKHLGFPLAMRA